MASKMSPSGKSVTGGEWLPVSWDATVGIMANILEMAGNIMWFDYILGSINQITWLLNLVHLYTV
jgi:hypothetical protein